MSTASDRIQLVGLSLADAHKISDELRKRSLALREELCALPVDGNPCVPVAIRAERERVLIAREALVAAIAKTFHGLG